jgi:hypothetical protein
MPLRTVDWQRLGTDQKPGRLDEIGHRDIGLGDVIAEAGALLDRERHGRIVVRMG